ncbi:MAG: DUF131 domain-containing protein [Methanobacteriota archaeon]|nr:MAG: DUF131 domain-containing protein [Euryarchaeota archaeon]
MDSCVRLIRWLGPASFVAGVLTMALAVAQRQANVYLVLVIPVIVGTGPLAFLGIILVFAGFLLTFLLWPSRLGEDPGNRDPLPTSPEVAAPARRWGGVLFLGPFPVIFGSDPRMTRTMLLVGLVLFLALLALTVIALFA